MKELSDIVSELKPTVLIGAAAIPKDYHFFLFSMLLVRVKDLGMINENMGGPGYQGRTGVPSEY